MINSIRLSILVALISILMLPADTESLAAVLDETVRVAIAKSASEITVAGEGLLVTDETGTPVVISLPASIKPFKDSLQVEGKQFKKLYFSASKSVYVNNKPYRGLAEVSVTDGGILVVNQLPLEEYLVGLINCEISSAWPIEAVKAQAIIARTYALNRKMARIASPYHLESSVIDQVYEGSLIEDSRAQRAVFETSGIVLTYNYEIIQAFYHSSCGGRTESCENIWGMSFPYLKGVSCQYCLTSPTATVWEYKLSLKELEERLKTAGYKISGLYDIKTGSQNSEGRLKDVSILASKGSLAITGEQFRKAIGYGFIKSTRFTLKNMKNEISFTGSGNGHGVGLCQWGAKQRALDGFVSAEILSYYYPGTELKKLSDIR
ncbi:MAG: SpoIID/LytB domain-containing protein [Desulfuromonadaceae bacterium]|nr:SpoIID/LytB domain-containing protein [Desulfuromonadaceae bacterium]MDD2854247.1 SpoIID/LytB domain-containing protein [Desulfuromonadaceae bacterium]